MSVPVLIVKETMHADVRLMNRDSAVTKIRFATVLLLLSALYASVFFAAPPYVACEDQYPDEWLDVFGIPRKSALSPKTRMSCPTGFFSDPVAYTHHFQCYRDEGSSIQTFTSELVVAVNLRC